MGKIGAETFQVLTFAFREEAIWQSPEMEYLSRMLNIQGAWLLAECAEMWNIFAVVFGMKVELRLWTFSIICVEL